MRMWMLAAATVLGALSALRIVDCFQLRNPAETTSDTMENYQIVFPVKVSLSSRFRRSNSARNIQGVSYFFSAFNRTFVLDLEPLNGLFSPSFHVMTFSDEGANSSSLNVHRGHHFRDCFYRGTVRHDSSSLVTLSSCKGLLGLIHTCHGDYKIERHLHLPSSSSAHRLILVEKHLNACRSNSDEQKYSKTPNGLHSGLREVKASRSKRSVSKEWNLEVLVVADSKMKRYHGDNLEMYILTLMSSVSLIYKDPSIGNDINISVVKLIVMKEGQDTGIIFPNAAKTLRNFCRWQQQQNDPSPNGVNHDTAILLTRENLCRQSKTCDTLGLAQSGMVCDRHSSCAVIEDNGLSAVFTIAHELGHILGIPHDDDKKCARFQEQGQRLHVMARMLDYNSHPWSWSDCSRHYVTTFLDAGHGYCLLNKSREDKLSVFEHSSTPAGELYDMDYQCQLVFGQGSKICPYMPVCKRLWCTMEDVTRGGCRTQHMPWADGTKCGLDKSCLHGECVSEPASVPSPQDGQWGEWQSYGPCSRSCGGGIKSSQRKCDSPKPINGGRYCVGERVRYKSCNTEDCPFGSQEFREEQCSAFNGKTFSFSGVDPDVQWEPHYEGIPTKDACKLFCRAGGTSAYFLLKEKVIDGTTCGPDVYDVCINGMCMPAGCDHKLGSKKVSDDCGVCGGDNSTCRVIHGEFANVQYGYNNVVIVPAGASKIEILQFGHENKEDENYLALMDSNNSYILNGNHMVSKYPMTLNFGGAVLQYSGSSNVVERINCTKQIQKDLYVQVLTVGSLDPPSVTYNYTISLENQVLYHWHLEENWSQCNSVCQGEQYRKAICINKRDGKTVSDGHCPDQERPQHLARVCNMHCFLSWNVTELSACSAPCGRGNISVDVKCTQHVESNGIHEIPDKFCAHIEPQPSHLKTCFGPCNITSWKFGEWSQCSKSCGGGFQQRKAVCMGDNHIELPDSFCDDNMKVTEQKCAEQDCPEWKTGPWNECSATCGSGERSRTVWCEEAGEKLANEYCNKSSVPSHTEECELLPCTRWREGRWGPCSVSCGKGSSKRSVQCFSLDDVEVSPSLCSTAVKPEDTRPCEQRPCRVLSDVFPLTPSRIFENTVPALPVSSKDIVMWKTGPWSMCSVSCGEGIRRRSVTCHNSINNEILPEKRCRKLERPSGSEECHFPACGQWRSGEWGECSVTCGEGIQMRLVVCLLNDGHKGEDTSCDLSYRPPQEQICRKSHCPDVLSEPLPDMDVIFNSVEGVDYWRTGSWGKCSRSCGGGIRRRQVACYDEGGHLSTYCDMAKKPIESTPCNTEKCPEWVVGEWTECSATCGVGFQSRQIVCTSSKGNRLPNERCPLSAPESMKRCKIKNCFHWSWSPWSECSSSCGQGTQTRFSQCIHGKRRVDDSKCNISSKPEPESRLCQGINCTYQWKKKKWSKCSASCGIGHKEREVMCVNGNNETVLDYFCRRKKKPRVKRRCHQYRCPFVWQVNHWSECSQTCGKGIETRDVTCHKVNAYKWVDPEPVPETNRENGSLWCKEEEKPSAIKGCNLGSCQSFVWRTGPWLQCSVGCGAGRQRRKVHCYSADGKQVKKNKCDKHLRPQKRRRCYMRPCPPMNCLDYKLKKNVSEDGEQEIYVRGRFVQIYCSGMNTANPKEYITLVKGESENYSEIYNKRLLSPETCPYGGIRYHSCDCISDESARFGLTRFHRVAVNISSLQMLTSDFTFSQTQIGQPVPFGESGDCYSMNKCPQGRFSVNLQGTGFVVSPETKWVSQGQHVSQKIRPFEGGQVIEGKCGGYCGMCAPDSQLGLLLDVAPP